ncbi:MAG TPA: CPBP family intramembrane glutamic endopeptidase, partial [Spirochaetia bacterium]|nr:CPBP family intramembrane glutamic endopeptidase [Spirochaetia bacterium]
MSTLVFAIRITVAVVAYFTVAVLSAIAVRRFGGDLKELEERRKGIVPLLGILANLILLGVILALFLLLDRRSLSDLGTGFGLPDALFTGAAAVITVALGIAFVNAVSRVQQRQITRQKLFREPAAAGTFLLTVALLLAVSAQEEVLFRGYVIGNLEMTGLFWIIVISTAIFVIIHIPTNRVTPAQIASWFLGGILLVSVYLVSGSIWVAIAVHFITDFTNVLVFNVAGRGGIYRFTPPLTASHRAWFRAIQTVVSVALL